MSRSATPPPECPDDLTLAAFIDACLPTEEMSAIRAHLVDCAACRTTVASVVRDVDSLEDRLTEPLPPLPESTRLRAERMVYGRPGTALARGVLTARSALLATVGVFVAIVIARFLHRGAPPVNDGMRGGSAPHEIPDMRGGESETFTTLSPKDQALLALQSPAALVLEWSAYGGEDSTSTSASPEEKVAYYVATVLDRAGRTVWSGRTDSTQISPPDSARIVPGATYTWSVAAHLTLGTSQETRRASFTVSR